MCNLLALHPISFTQRRKLLISVGQEAGWVGEAKDDLQAVKKLKLLGTEPLSSHSSPHSWVTI